MPNYSLLFFFCRNGLSMYNKEDDEDNYAKGADCNSLVSFGQLKTEAENLKVVLDGNKLVLAASCPLMVCNLEGLWLQEMQIMSF